MAVDTVREVKLSQNVWPIQSKRGQLRGSRSRVGRHRGNVLEHVLDHLLELEAPVRVRDVALCSGDGGRRVGSN